MTITDPGWAVACVPILEYALSSPLATEYFEETTRVMVAIRYQAILAVLGNRYYSC